MKCRALLTQQMNADRQHIKALLKEKRFVCVTGGWDQEKYLLHRDVNIQQGERMMKGYSHAGNSNILTDTTIQLIANEYSQVPSKRKTLPGLHKDLTST